MNDPIALASTMAARIERRESLADLYADDAIFDVNVPMWRFQLKGPDAIAAKFLDPGWWPENVHGTIESTVAAPDAVVFELTSTYEGPGGTWYARNAHILNLGRDGRITRHTLYCTGDWDPATIARQAIEAPMVE